MPTAPLRPCTQPGCPNLSNSGRCSEHRQRFERERGTRQERGYGAAWQKARRQFIADQFAEGNVHCADCGKPFYSERGVEVDHIRPHRGDAELFWDSERNWQLLCRRCHSRKTMNESVNGMSL